MSNYPPGVSGNEFAIAGPDFEEERDIECPHGHKPCLVMGYHWDRWAYCFEPTCIYFEGNYIHNLSFTPPYTENEQAAIDYMVKLDQEMMKWEQEENA